MNDYGADLARIHDEGHGDLARRTGPAIVCHLRNAGIRRGLVVDLGCGSGILTRDLIGSGYDVLGVDPSPAMLQIARRRAPAATFVQRRAEDIELPTCVAVVATGEAITYLSVRTAPTAHIRQHIRRLSVALARGGLFIFDAIVEGATASMKYRTWRAAPDWAALTDVTEDLRRHFVRRRITTFARVGTAYRRSNTDHRVGVYSREGLLRELRARGFTARTRRGYGSSELGPRRLVFHARLV